MKKKKYTSRRTHCSKLISINTEKVRVREGVEQKENAPFVGVFTGDGISLINPVHG